MKKKPRTLILFLKMELTFSNKLAVPAMLQNLSKLTEKLQRNDVAMCYYAPENKLYVVIIGSDHFTDVVHGKTVEVTWTKAMPGTLYEHALCFTTNYVPPKGPGFIGESSCVDRACLHKIPTAVMYSEVDNMVQLPMAFGSMVADLLRVAQVFNSDLKYPSLLKWSDSYKWKINFQLTRAAEVMRLKCTNLGEMTAALYLDGPCAMTSKCLLRNAQYPRDALFAPNKNAEVCRLITAATNVYAPHTSLLQFLKNDNLPPFSFVWIDATGAWDTGCNVREMVECLFTKRRLASHARVAYTVSLRGRSGGVHDRAIRDMNAHIRLIKKWSKKSKYNVVSFVMYLNTTSSPMLTLAFSASAK